MLKTLLTRYIVSSCIIVKMGIFFRIGAKG